MCNEFATNPKCSASYNPHKNWEHFGSESNCVRDSVLVRADVSKNIEVISRRVDKNENSKKRS